MKALTLPRLGQVVLEEVADPEILDPDDVVLRVTATAICGSDLHAYNGRIAGVPPGMPIGHEYMGIIEEAGPEVSRFCPGERVTGSFFTVCGQCWACRRGFYTQCLKSQMFGFGPRFGSLAGTQAEWVRIPHADYTLIRVPDEVSDEAGVLVGDILSTAYFAVDRGNIRPGDTVAVVGLGPVGLLSVELAYLFGAAQVIGLDMVPDRLNEAQRLGATTIAVGDDSAKQIRAMTEGRGADAVIEAVGSEQGLDLATKIARGFATISAAGVYTETALSVPMGRAFAKDLTIRAGTANVPAVAPAVIELLRCGRIRPERLFTKKLPLSAGPLGYQWFAERKALKILLRPGQ